MKLYSKGNLTERNSPTERELHVTHSHVHTRSRNCAGKSSKTDSLSILLIKICQGAVSFLVNIYDHFPRQTTNKFAKMIGTHCSYAWKRPLSRMAEFNGSLITRAISRSTFFLFLFEFETRFSGTRIRLCKYHQELTCQRTYAIQTCQRQVWRPVRHELQESIKNRWKIRPCKSLSLVLRAN